MQDRGPSTGHGSIMAFEVQLQAFAESGDPPFEERGPGVFR